MTSWQWMNGFQTIVMLEVKHITCANTTHTFGEHIQFLSHFWYGSDWWSCLRNGFGLTIHLYKLWPVRRLNVVTHASQRQHFRSGRNNIRITAFMELGLCIPKLNSTPHNKGQQGRRHRGCSRHGSDEARSLRWPKNSDNSLMYADREWICLPRHY